jgi:hypothetical protein
MIGSRPRSAPDAEGQAIERPRGPAGRKRSCAVSKWPPGAAPRLERPGARASPPQSHETVSVSVSVSSQGVPETGKQSHKFPALGAMPTVPRAVPSLAPECHVRAAQCQFHALKPTPPSPTGRRTTPSSSKSPSNVGARGRQCGDAGLSAHDDAGAPPQGEGRLGRVTCGRERRGEGRATQGQALPKVINLRGRLGISGREPQSLQAPRWPKLVTYYASVLTS